ncbi:MAG: glycoside hydrolase family 3 C-terminal domain-containing protein [Erysipelotrichaceae bacterium]|jgi:beta-glucosidase|nr:glycoside hydrolase family 3 C-terminal domain-containing protein [Erysipelotrichaceae bacterium]
MSEIKDKLICLSNGSDNWHTVEWKEEGLKAVTMSDGSCGLRQEGRDENGNLTNLPTTAFPYSCLSACSFDVELLYELGAAIGKEAKSRGIDLLLGPAINHKRSPQGGRNFEYFSEDPVLTGTLASAFVKGLQSQKVGAVIKHFALNNQETARVTSDSIADQRTKRELYLKQFEMVVKEAKPWAVMTSYNKVDSIYTSENKQLISDLLRDTWGFEGLVMSDWGGIRHPQEALNAGLDVAMPGESNWHHKQIKQALSQGIVKEEQLLKVKQRLKELSQKTTEKTETIDEDLLCDLAIRAALESVILLKNDNQALPLKQNQGIALIGEFATHPRYNGGGSANMRARKNPSFLDILKAQNIPVDYAPGFQAEDYDQSLIKQAKELMEHHDTIVFCAGFPGKRDCEGADCFDLSLPKAQVELIEAAAANDKTVIVLLFAGRPILMPWIDKVDAVVMAYLPGEGASEALYELLFGKANFSGHLAETFVLNLKDQPATTFASEHIIPYKEGIFSGYRYYTSREKEVLFPFGYGLSYTSFEYSDLQVKQEKDQIQVTLQVKNTGDIAGATVVQLYTGEENSPIDRPLRELRAFKKVYLEPSQSEEICFDLCEEDFSYFDNRRNNWRTHAGYYRVEVGESCIDIRLRQTLVLGDQDTDELLEKVENYGDPQNMSDAQFEELLGRKLPVYQATPFHEESTIKELRSCWLGRYLEKILLKEVQKQGQVEQAEYSQSEMLLNIEPYLPFYALEVYGDGMINHEMVLALLEIANHHSFKGFWHLIQAYMHKEKT